MRGQLPTGKTGLSIVEVLLMVAIVLLILAIALPAIRTNRVKKQIAACVLELDLVDRASRNYASTHGGFPADIETLVPEFILRVPACPSGGAYTLGTPEGDLPTCSIPGHGL